MSLDQKAVAIRRAFRSWTDYTSDIEELMEELVDAGQADDVKWFDDVWSGVYDWADDNRVWVATL